MLLSGQTRQTIQSFIIDGLEMSNVKCTFIVQTRVGKRHLDPIEFLAFPEDEKLRVVKHLEEYMAQTVRKGCKQLLLSQINPLDQLARIL